MKYGKMFVMTGLLLVGFTWADDVKTDVDLVGRRVAPGAPVASADDRISVIREMVYEMSSENVDAVTDYINELYGLKDLYVQVLQKERELRQSHISNDQQKELMKEYMQLLNKEKLAAKVVIDNMTRDLDAHESRLLQVMAKIYRIGDVHMRTTIQNVRNELRKYIRYQLHNAGTGREFYVDAMRFIDQYLS
jgi:hypothetical protein